MVIGKLGTLVESRRKVAHRGHTDQDYKAAALEGNSGADNSNSCGSGGGDP